MLAFFGARVLPGGRRGAHLSQPFEIETNAQALALARWLAQEGWDDIFLDLDPERGLKAGERFSPRVAQGA